MSLRPLPKPLCVSCNNPFPPHQRGMLFMCDTCRQTKRLCKGERCPRRLLAEEKDYCSRCKCTVASCTNSRCNVDDYWLMTCEYHAKCATKNCTNMIENQVDPFVRSYCDPCKDQWQSPCVRCMPGPGQLPNMAISGTLCCPECWSNLPWCLHCRKRHVLIRDSGRTFNYCSQCLCRSKGCQAQKAPNQNLCVTCLERDVPRCGKIGQYGPCPNPKSNPKFGTCTKCCRADKCTRPRKDSKPYCTSCHVQFTYHNGSELCSQPDCFRYTTSRDEECCESCKHTFSVGQILPSKKQ